jgi:hypothetical protein
MLFRAITALIGALLPPVQALARGPEGHSIVAELKRLKTELRCAPTDDRTLDALRYAVHFVGDIHQPLHTVGEGRGGNDVTVEVGLAGAKTRRGGPCPIMTYRSNLHRVWDVTLIMAKATTWSWGAYVDRLARFLNDVQAPGQCAAR